MDDTIYGKTGLPNKKKYFYQDNECTIKIEKNCRKSCSGKSRYLHVRFFLIKDQLEK